uniref:Uncharacterized protein n=1 Tax=Homalodisca liturata TaxID=320908 RepID=A0A1B6JXW2_9HEMI
MDQMDEFVKFEERSKPVRKSIRRNLFSEKRPSLLSKTKQVFSTGILKINKVFIRVLHTVESATQSLRFSSYKRYEMDDYDLVPSAFQTPSRIARSILGRTPIKLYSPFDIDSPARFS